MRLQIGLQCCLLQRLEQLDREYAVFELIEILWKMQLPKLSFFSRSTSHVDATGPIESRAIALGRCFFNVERNAVLSYKASECGSEWNAFYQTPTPKVQQVINVLTFSLLAP